MTNDFLSDPTLQDISGNYVAQRYVPITPSWLAKAPPDASNNVPNGTGNLVSRISPGMGARGVCD